MSRRWLLLLLGPTLLALPRVAHADVRLPRLFGDHMVLQREMPTPVWGWAEPGETIVVKLGRRSAKTTAGADGRWRVELPARKAGGPFTLVVKGRNTVRVSDVLVGEVWLCSGQSNMAMTVRASRDGAKEVASAKDDRIRHFQSPRLPMGEPQDDLEASWQVCSPRTAARFTACGYFMARELRETLRVPIGLLHASWGGTRIEPWTAPIGFEGMPALQDIADAAKANEGKKPANHQQPTVLYNGMVHPLVGYAMRGAIWYQGESNRQDGDLYTEKMKALIGGWRRLWGLGEFPFHYVQIAPFRYGKEAPGVLPTFWEAQAAVQGAVPNTGMVVTNDIGDLDDIHPKNKQDVGHRLALLALRRTYGKDVVDQGPTFHHMTTEKGALRLTFDNADGRLRSRDRKPLTDFEVAGRDTGFVAAKAKLDGDTILLTADEVSEPLAMRFAWHKLAQPNLVNKAGLPASAFRAGSMPKPDALPQVEAACGYRLVADLDLHKLGAHPRYDVDHRSEIETAFDRVGYLLELRRDGGDVQYVWVSMKAFTDDAAKLGLPTAASGARFQQAVESMDIRTNVEGLPSGSGLEGRLEFWPSNYGPQNTAEVPGASSQAYDFGDSPAGEPDGYGSMQVHCPKAKQTLFAINHWRRGGSAADIGIGNSTLDPKRPDWTFAANGAAYVHKRLRVFVRPAR